MPGDEALMERVLIKTGIGWVDWMWADSHECIRYFV